MSRNTAFNQPLRAAPSTSNVSFPAAAVTLACNQFAALRAKTFDELMELAAQAYAGEGGLLHFTVSSVLNSTNSGSVEHQLAEAVYFRQGHNLLLEYRTEDMTRLQKEHEAVAAGIATPDEVVGMNGFVLRGELSAWVSSLGLAQVDVDGDTSSSHSSSSDEDIDGDAPMEEDPHDSGYETGPSRTKIDGNDDDEDDTPMEEDADSESDYESGEDESKRIYVRLWKKDLGKYVTYAY